MGRQWRQHVNETTRCHWAHQSGQPSGKSKASTICFTFPLFSHRSLSLCPPELIPSPGFKCHLVLSTWTMWNFSSHSFGADILFIFWPVRFRWTFECPCGKRWLYVCIFRTLRNFYCLKTRFLRSIIVETQMERCPGVSPPFPWKEISWLCKMGNDDICGCELVHIFEGL